MPPSPLKEIPLLDRVSQRINQLEEEFGRLDVSDSQAPAPHPRWRTRGSHVAKMLPSFGVILRKWTSPFMTSLRMKFSRFKIIMRQKFG